MAFDQRVVVVIQIRLLDFFHGVDVDSRNSLIMAIYVKQLNFHHKVGFI